MYLIDGNNVIGGWVGWHRDKAGSRRRLLQDLARLAGRKQTRLAVVFDGAPDHAFPDESSYCGVKIFYARRGFDADARILEMVEAEPNKRNLTVVTSDRKLAVQVRLCGVRVVRSGQFRRLLDETKDSESPNGEDRSPQIGEKIGKKRGAEETTAVWLRYFGVDENEAEGGEDP